MGIGQAQANLIQKVEGLTLYAIAQDKRQEMQGKLIAGLNKLLLEMKGELAGMKKSKQAK